MPDSRRERASRARLLFKNRPLARLRERLPSHKAGKNPLFARAGGSSFGGPLPAGRATRGIAALVGLALLLFAGRAYVGKSFNVSAEIERIVRRELIPNLEKQWKTKIEVGAIESDWLSRVTLNDIVIGRDSKLPTGALVRARRVVLNVDLVGLGLRRAQFPDAISGVTVEAPQIYLARDRRGGWNFDRFLQTQTPGGPSLAWTGRVQIFGGRLVVRDETLRGASDIPMLADAREIAGFADFAPQFPVRFAATAQKLLLPLRRAQIGALSASGAAATDGKGASVTVQFPSAPAPILADYAFPQREIVAQRGTLAGRVQVLLDGKTVLPRGQIEVQNVDGFAASLTLPGAKKPLALQKIRGPLTFSGTAFSTSGLQFSALAMPWKMAGAVAAEKTPLFDVRLASTRALVPQLVALAGQNSLPGALSSAPARLTARLSGTPRQFSVSGVLDAPNARFAAPRVGQIATPLARAAFAAQVGAQTRLALRLNAPNARFGAPDLGNGRAETLFATLNFAQNGPMETQFALRNWRAESPRYGAVFAPILRGRAATPSLVRPDWRGAVRFDGAQTGQIRLAAISPQLAQNVQNSGLLNGEARFSGLGARGLNAPNAVVRAKFGLSSVTVGGGELGALRLANLAGAAQFSGGEWRRLAGRAQSESGAFFGNFAGKNGAFFVSAPDLRVAPAQLRTLLAPQGLDFVGDLRGRVTLAGTPERLAARFDLRAPVATLQNTQNRAFLAALSGARLRGGAQFGAGEKSFPDSGAPILSGGAAVLTAQSAVLGSGKIGKTGLDVPAAVRGARLVGLQVTLEDGQNPVGRVAARRVALTLVAGGQRRVLTLQNVGATFQKTASGLSVPRVAANWAGGRLNGFARLGAGQLEGAILGANLDGVALQRFAAPASLAEARLSGPVGARFDFDQTRGALNGTLRAVLERGGVQIGGETVPVSNARVEIGFQNGDFSRLQLREAALWSRGGRVAASGALDVENFGFDGTLKIQNARLTTLAALPGVKFNAGALRDGGADGLLSGEFRAVWNTQNPQLDGKINVRLAHFAGIDLEASVGDVTARKRGGGLDFRLANLVGRAEGAPFDGEIELSQEDDFWRVQLHTTGVAAARLTRLGPSQTRNAPLRGELAGDVDLSGTLAGGVKPQNGFVNLQTGPLTWRGKQLGALRADVGVTEGIVRARRFDLLRVGAAENDPNGALLSLKGRLPLTGDEPVLDAQFRLDQAPVSAFLDAIAEVRRLTREDGTPEPMVEKIGALVASLPPGVSGQVAVDANLSGSWKAPRIEVKNLTLHDGRARIPQGGFSPPATLDAEFLFQNGVLTIQKGDFRLKRAYKDDDGEDDDTLVRVAAGGSVALDGPVDLSADVLNANLSELAIWIPALRGRDGKPLLRGKLPIFSVAVAGETGDPQVTGSVEAEDLVFNANTLDALRVSRFQLAGGQLRIEPGKLTVAKGEFQSSAAWGSVPWSWNPPGPQFDAPLEVHLPVQKRDFGALASVFLPSLTAADADEFSGSLDIMGSLNAPAISGAVKVRGGRFRLDPAQTFLEAGVENLSGGLKFLNGNQLVIDADDPLKGRLVAATAVRARTSGKRGVEDKNAPQLAGEFALGGNIAFDFDPRNALQPRAALARHRYDLRFSLDKGAYSSPQISGVTNLAAGVLFQTGPGQPETSQKLRWMAAAQGKGSKRAKGGEIFSVGALMLNAQFPGSLDALFTSRGENFDDYAAFAEMPVAARVVADNFADRRSQIVFKDFAAQVPQVGNGVVEGRLVLDNGRTQQEAPPAAVVIQTASLTGRLARRRRTSLFGPSFDARDDLERDFPAPRDERELPSGATPPGASPPDDEDESAPTLRLGGQLTLFDSEIFGAPTESGGLAGKLSFLPAAPRLDAKLLLGKNVQIVTPTLRAALGGEIALGGTPQNPQIFGVLAAREGQVRFPNARARLEEGRITVAATRDPVSDTLRTRVEVDATARGQAGRYAITVKISGPLDLGEATTQNLRVDVTSNPPLSQDEAFAQLLGTSVRELRADGSFETGNTSEAYARAVLQLVSAPLFSGVENSLAQALGLTSVGFEYRFNEPLGVQLTKALGDRVIISYRRSLGRGSGGLTPYQLRIDYRLKGDLLLGLQTDEREEKQVTLQKTFRF